jgi:hypothetical protein
MESNNGIIFTGEKRINPRKPVLVSLCPTTNPTCNDPGANPGLRGEKPVTDRLGHGRGVREISHKAFVLFLSPYRQIPVKKQNKFRPLPPNFVVIPSFVIVVSYI